MATLPPDIRDVVESFAKNIAAIYPGSRVILFGSYAKGTYHAQSDIDIALVLPDGYGRDDQLEIFRMIRRESRRFDYDIQPQVFFAGEFEDPIGIAEEIAEYGLDITAAIQHN